MAQVPVETATFRHRRSAEGRSLANEINTAAAVVDVSGRELVRTDAQVVGSMDGDTGLNRRRHRKMRRGDLDVCLPL